MLYGSILHIPLTYYHLIAAKQEPYQTADLLTIDTEENYGEKKGQENGPVGRQKDKAERTVGVGRRTREEIVK